MNTPYAKGCPSLVKKFYDDFDLLPYEIKEILWNQSKTPDFDDCEFLPKGHVDRDRLILIDFNTGLIPVHTQRAADRLGLLDYRGTLPI